MNLKTLSHLAEIAIAVARNGMTIDIATIDKFLELECNAYGDPESSTYAPIYAEMARLDRAELVILNESQQAELLGALGAIAACKFIKI